MTIIEQNITPKSPTKRSEDGIVATADFIAVIDGSTSKSQVRCHRDFSLRSRSGGELAMTIVSKVVRTLPKDASCHQCCVSATKAIRSRYIKSRMEHLAMHPEDRIACSAAIFSRLRRELWLIGDCQALLISGDTQLYIDNPKPAEQELAQARADIIRRSPKPWDHFLTDDTARREIIPRMLQTMQGQNTTYSVFDGFPIPEAHVRTIALDFQPWQIVLATDGYPFLCPTLQESEQRLEQQRKNDPLNIGPDFMATKAFAEGNNSFDDRAYIRFSI